MKAKEIAQRVLENLATGLCDAGEAYEVEIVADIKRFQDTVKERNITTGSKNEATNRIGLQAWMRLCNEFNTKWNSVAFQLMERDGRYIHSENLSSFVFGNDAFVHIFAGAMFRELPKADQDKIIKDILSMSTTPTLSKWDVQMRVTRERDEQASREFIAAYRKTHATNF